MKQYDLSAIMSRAWAIFRKGGIVYLPKPCTGLGRAPKPAHRTRQRLQPPKHPPGLQRIAKRGQSGKWQAMKSFTAARRFSAPS